MAFVVLNLFHEKAIVTLAISSLLIAHFSEFTAWITPSPTHKNKMKITEIQEYKQISFTVDLDLDSIKAAINQLDEILHDEEFNADVVIECCDLIEELATAISSGVINR